MDNLRNAMVFISTDGDGIGNQTARAALADDPESLKAISARIDAGNQAVKSFAIKNRGEIISFGGDEADLRIPLVAVERLEALRADYSFVVGATLTIGVGETLSQSSKALIVGKLRGKNQICQYDDSVEQEYQQATQEANAIDPVQEEKQKIGKAYMKDNKNPADPFPVHPENGGQSKDSQVSEKGQLPIKNEDNSPNKDSSGKEEAVEAAGNTSAEEAESDGCPYCEDENNDLGEEEDCPYCAEEGQEGQGDTSDCPYCAEAHDELDHQHDENCPHCQELDAAQPQETDARIASMDQSVNPDSISAPAMEEDGPGGQNAFDGTPSEKEALAQQGAPQDNSDSVGLPADPLKMGGADPVVDPPAEPFAEEHKSPDDILDEFDAVHGEPSQEDDASIEQTDDTGIAEADKGQEDNTSRPEDFNGKIPMGSEDPNNTDGSNQDEPNYGDVMQQDLNNGADDIQKEKVGNMVRESLMNFKNTKQYLEQAQAQSPEFYQANISMIRSMIEMAKLLGFGGENENAQEVQPELGQEESQLMPEQSEPNMTDFPKHPDNGGQEDSAPQAPERKQGDWSDPFPVHQDQGGGDMSGAGKPKTPPEE